MSVTEGFAWLRRCAAEAKRIARGIVGENAYERYLEHQRAHHPDAPVLSEREFWRQYIDRQDANPGSRCC